MGTDGDYVAIFKGVDQSFPGLTLSRVYEKQTLQVDKLPTYSRQQVEGTIQADDLAGARTIVTELQRTADECAAKATPKPTTKPADHAVGQAAVSTPPKTTRSQHPDQSRRPTAAARTTATGSDEHRLHVGHPDHARAPGAGWS